VSDFTCTGKKRLKLVMIEFQCIHTIPTLSQDITLCWLGLTKVYGMCSNQHIIDRDHV